MPLATKPRSAKPRSTRRYAVGSLVRVRFGHKVLHARVVENRGPIGVGGRHIVRIEVVNTSIQDNAPFEVPEDNILATPAVKSRR